MTVSCHSTFLNHVLRTCLITKVCVAKLSTASSVLNLALREWLSLVYIYPGSSKHFALAVFAAGWPFRVL